LVLREATDEDKSDWPFYYKKVNKFLIKYAQVNILTKFERPEAARGNTFEDFEKPDVSDAIPF